MAKNKHNQSVGSSIQRDDDRINQTGEVFTPMELVYQMIDEIPTKILKDPNSTFLDNSAGCGNFLYGLLMELLVYHDKQHILDHMLYGVEFMADNHQELCERLGVPVDHPHFVCADALTYDYSFGEKVGVEQFFS